MKARRALKVVAVSALALAGAAAVYDLLGPMRPLGPHRGDGVFEDLSRRAGPFPVLGYRVGFPEFDLGQAHESTYQVAGLPGLGRDCGVYLAIPDPDMRIDSLNEARALEGSLLLEVRDG